MLKTIANGFVQSPAVNSESSSASVVFKFKVEKNASTGDVVVAVANVKMETDGSNNEPLMQRTAHVMTFEVGAALEDAKWQAPAYCFETTDYITGLLADNTAKATERQIGETSLNETSSRSHQIIRLTVESSACEFLGAYNSSMLAGSVSFVDLAGSERASQTLSVGSRLKEGNHINRSLLTLGTVIRKLRSSLQFTSTWFD
ncbi:hypothetical protein POM88_012273 [Heracleum sosnowskyi]|uniref:Kinesin motor domain-containing protein n=1 Tax=Heracleum sosnowskyi TaxID=360622 RepID=A0AAD8IW55_9APIA|nr:hypothetical protein POM88_012273 [Heracleum sosnowskyi]